MVGERDAGFAIDDQNSQIKHVDRSEQMGRYPGAIMLGIARLDGRFLDWIGHGHRCRQVLSVVGVLPLNEIILTWRRNAPTTGNTKSH